VHASKRRGVVFGEGLTALDASEALKPVPVLTEFLAESLAVVTGHFGLPFLRSKPIMEFWSALRLAPRADLAPLVARNYRRGRLFASGPEGGRTPISPINSRVLSPLSYRPVHASSSFFIRRQKGTICDLLKYY